MLPVPKIRKELADAIRQCSVDINLAEQNGNVLEMVREIQNKRNLLNLAIKESTLCK